MNTFGHKIRITVFGASHEQYIGLTIDGFPAGIFLDQNAIAAKLKLRQGLLAYTSKRFEEDRYQIISGLFNGITTGAPITFLVENKDVKSEDYDDYYGLARPSHADYPNFQKYQGFNDYRGGGTASGRVCIVLIILGAICEQLLKEKNFIISSRMKSIYQIEDGDFPITDAILNQFNNEALPVYDAHIKELMMKKIKELREENDSCGGVVETYIKNLPVGLGNPFFTSFESLISHLVFSIPGVKGIEFGKGFAITQMLGSKANDQMFYQDNQLKYKSNHSGGINGGITNGNTVIFRSAFKPTPSISQPQQTINYLNKTNQIINIKGRHDVIFAIKGLQVVNAITNYAVLELLSD